MTRRRPAPRQAPARRVNAPIRPRAEGSTFPDLLFAITAAAWTMAAGIAGLTLVRDEVGGGDLGLTIARVFAATLAIAGLLVFLLGVSILGEHRNRADHYVWPMVLGAGLGLIEVFLLFLPRVELMPLVPILLIFALRPVRRGFSAIFTTGGRR